MTQAPLGRLSPYLLPLMVFLLLVALSEGGLRYVQQIQTARNAKGLASLGNNLTQNLQRQLTDAVESTRNLQILLEVAAFQTHDFPHWAEHLTRQNRGVTVLQLAPQGVVRHIYPLAGQEKALGLDLFQNPNNREGALAARESGLLTFVGPIRLVQNGKLAVIARRPIYRAPSQKESFWGFATALIYLDELLGDSLQQLESQGYRFQLEGYDPARRQGVLIAASQQPPQDQPQVFKVVVPNGVWTLALESDQAAANRLWAWRTSLFALAAAVALLLLRQQTKLEQRRSRIEALNAELHQAIAAKNRFFALISHDLKNPIGSLTTIFHDLTQSPADLTPQLYQTIRLVTWQTQELLQELLEWAKSQQGLTVMQLERIPLLAALHQASQTLSATAQIKGITVTANAPASLAVKADASMLAAVLRNLLTNAIKFSTSGSQVHMVGFLEEGQVKIEVQDQGGGMSLELQAQLFEPGRLEAPGQGTNGEVGTGMGLVLCAEFVRRMGGQIGVESHPDQGSKFWFTLPKG